MAFNYFYPMVIAFLIFLVGAGLYLVYYFGKPVIKSIFLGKKIDYAAAIMQESQNIEDLTHRLQRANLIDEDLIKLATAKVKKKSKEAKNDDRQSERIIGEAKGQEKGYSGRTNGDRTETGSKKGDDGGGGTKNDHVSDPRYARSGPSNGKSDRSTAKESRYFT